MLPAIAKCAVVLAVGGAIATVAMIVVLGIAPSGSRWSMATSWPIAALSLSVTIGGWWINRTVRQSATSEAASSPPSRIRQTADNVKIHGGRDSFLAVNVANSQIDTRDAGRDRES